MNHVKIIVSGKVQGVFFRQSTLQKAEELKVAGFVRNEPDGTVYIEAEGASEAIAALIAWCKEGSEHAEVEQAQIMQGEPKDFTGFTIQKT